MNGENYIKRMLLFRLNVYCLLRVKDTSFTVIRDNVAAGQRSNSCEFISSAHTRRELAPGALQYQALKCSLSSEMTWKWSSLPK